jgi:hypothetical protein
VFLHNDNNKKENVLKVGATGKFKVTTLETQQRRVRSPVFSSKHSCFSREDHLNEICVRQYIFPKEIIYIRFAGIPLLSGGYKGVGAHNIKCRDPKKALRVIDL